MDLRAGMKLTSVVCSTEVIVVRPPTAPGVLQCGSEPMVPVQGGHARDRVTGTEAYDGDGRIQLGKRYHLKDSGIEVICTRPGVGPLALDGALLTVKPPKSLPPSD